MAASNPTLWLSPNLPTCFVATRTASSSVCGSRPPTISRKAAAYSTSGSPRICFLSFRLATTSGSERCSP
ncbi:hypothetical protein PF005_g24695 [Phytophthora fragariae]|uniref:Uncharacterized protein n=1 Tax=Phytophthora fragariae TaxID=53985 RepID=A0A6A3DPK5_9STRA|nr:hypothetical protein PF003_g20396 [Phytophthora fragariae]KAE8924064.1 hypothetical protein PF009_g25700 [Phytophthora fragariae]KAE8977951.1 hypothetical protein PF011_g23449 [Phytophthora fragariae]KAE9176975.1 hypothetical protein PF005_g24695 [Phytophthora fragariae]KAE9351358.1 hypothetical protein PF008_g5978 [Phytophthora fragariae]